MHMKKLMLLAVLAALTGFANEAKVVRDIAYDAAIGKDGVGDLYYPANWTDKTPVVLVIHGGGWSGMERHAVDGIATFMRDAFGFAAFNIEYRLASAKNRWPACGDDCVKAANWLLSKEFAETYGLRPARIWVIGGSAGGHLTLWTALSLPADRLAGAIAISPIADPVPDCAVHRGRYTTLFGRGFKDEDLKKMDPQELIRRGQAPLLITHADKDAVVPIASSRAFAAAYRKAGNACELFEYAHDAEPNEGGHYIWIPGSKPHRLTALLEKRIAQYVRSRLGTASALSASVEGTKGL